MGQNGGNGQAKYRGNTPTQTSPLSVTSELKRTGSDDLWVWF